MTKIRARLREIYGKRQYRISRDGSVSYYKTNCEGNYWAYLGNINDIDFVERCL